MLPIASICPARIVDRRVMRRRATPSSFAAICAPARRDHGIGIEPQGRPGDGQFQCGRRLGDCRRGDWQGGTSARPSGRSAARRHARDRAGPAIPASSDCAPGASTSMTSAARRRKSRRAHGRDARRSRKTSERRWRGDSRDWSRCRRSMCRVQHAASSFAIASVRVSRPRR